MRTIWALYRARKKVLIKTVTERDVAQMTVVVSFFLVLILFVVGLYLFFSSIFSFLQKEPFAEPMNLYLLVSSFFLFFLLTSFSAMLVSIARLFRSKEVTFLFTTPSSVQSVFLYKFLEVWLLGSWALFILGLPTLFAFGATYHAGWVFYILCFVALLFLSFIATQIGALLGFFIASVFGSSSYRVLTVALIFFAIPLAYVLSSNILPSDFSSFFEAENVSSMYVYLQELSIFSSLFPSSWLVHLLLGYVGNTSSVVLINSTKLFVLSGFLGVLLLVTTKRMYRSVFGKFQEGIFFASEKDRAKRPSVPFPRFIRGSFGALLEKDLILWVRNFPEMLYFFFLLLLFSLYFFVLSRVPEIKQAPVDILSTLAAFHFAAGGYLLTTFALRFIFPSISLEGAGIRFLKSSPISLSRVFWEKFVFSFVFLLVLAGVMILVEGRLFRINDVIFSVTAIMTGVMSITITSIMVSFGAAFPKYDVTNSERISTSLPGIFATLLCLLYVIIVSFFLQGNFSYYFEQFVSGNSVSLSSFWPAIGSVFLISLFLNLIILLFGAKSLGRQEV